MSNEKKQIEEMARDLQETHDYEGCEAWHCGGCEYEKYGKNYFCSSIKQAEKMTARDYRKQEWISVEDRLPEENQPCLIFTKIHFIPDHVDDPNYYEGVELSWYYKDIGFISENGLYTKLWMPLPEAPKMKGGAE